VSGRPFSREGSPLRWIQLAPNAATLIIGETVSVSIGAPTVRVKITVNRPTEVLTVPLALGIRLGA
jgi:hypothetical protein